jgi:hypothetical protein
LDKGLAAEVTKHRKDGLKISVLSSDEEDMDDTSIIRNASEANHQGMKPKLTQYSKKGEGDGEGELETNRGFYVPKLAGFEYLEGPENL